MFPLYDWYSLKGQLIRKKSFVRHEKTKHPQGCTRVYHIDSMLNFLLKAIPFIFVISSEKFKQKQLICNLLVTNLSDIHNFEGVRF